MLVKELLDKQDKWPPIILIDEKDYEDKYCSAYKISGYLYELHERWDLYDEYGEREVDYYYHDLDDNNKLVMLIKLEDMQ